MMTWQKRYWESEAIGVDPYPDFESSFPEFETPPLSEFEPPPLSECVTSFTGFEPSVPDILSQYFDEPFNMVDPFLCSHTGPSSLLGQQISNAVIDPGPDFSDANRSDFSAERSYISAAERPYFFAAERSCISVAERPCISADERLDFSADERLDFSADERLDSSADERLDSSADERLDSSAGKRLDSSAAKGYFLGDHNYSQFEMLDIKPPRRIVEAEINVASKEPSRINFFDFEAKIPPVNKGKRPVGRPKKTVPKISDFEQERIVDTENMIVKRGRVQRAMVFKSLLGKKVLPVRQKGKEKAKKKYASVETSPASSIDSLPMYSEPVASTSRYVPKNYSEFVSRKAKETAKQKISQSKRTENVSNKKLDHNRKEQGRRKAMKVLFDTLKAIVPGDLLIDQQGKIKKNPSKNTILCGSRTLITRMEKRMKFQSELVRRKIFLNKKMWRLKN